MGRVSLHNNNISHPLFSSATRWRPQVKTISGAVSLTEGGPGLIVLNPGTSALNVTLYTPANTSYVTHLRVINSAAATGTLVIKNPAAATIGTLAVGGMMDLFCVAGTWLAFQTAKSA